MPFLSLESLTQDSTTESQLFSTFVSLSSALSADVEGQAASSDVLHRVQGKDIGIFNLHLFPLGHGSTFSVSCALKDKNGTGLDAVVFKRTIPDIKTQEQERFKKRIRSMMLELRVLTHNPIRKCKNIVKLLGIAWEMDPFLDNRRWPVLVMERAARGTLLDHLQHVDAVRFKSKAHLSLDVILGLEALHTCGIFHGDLKLENVLVFDNEDVDSQADRPFVAKLADFGGVILDAHKTAGLSSRTKRWSAPESRNALDPNQIAATDVYALGFTLWRTFANGVDPFEKIQLRHGDPQNRTLENLVEEMKQSDIAMLKHLDSLHCFKNREELLMAKDISRCTIRVDSNLRSLEAAKSLLQNVLSTQRDPFDADGLASHQLLLQARFVQFSFEGIENLDRSVSRYLSKELAQAAEDSNYPATAHEAAYGLAVLYLNDIIDAAKGDDNKISGLFFLVKAAISGNHRARAVLQRAFRALEREIPANCVEQVEEWLQQTGSRGYFIALEDLKNMGKFDVLNSTKQILRLRYGGTGAERFLDDLFPNSFPNHTEIFEAGLLEKFQSGQDMSGPFSRFGDRFFHFAASLNLPKLTAAIVSKRLDDLNILNVNGETPLLLACRAGNFETAMLLMGAGADPCLANDYGDTALHWLISFDEDVAPIVGCKILESTPDINAVAEAFSYIHCGENAFPHGTPLMRAVSRNREDVVDFLLLVGADPNFYTVGGSAINLAAQLHYSKILERLLSVSQDKEVTIESSTGRSLLIPAITGGSLEASGTFFGRIRRHGQYWQTRAQDTLRVLLNAGATDHLANMPGWRGGTALVLATTFAQPDIVEFLLKNGCLASINSLSLVPNDPEQSCTPLIMSIWTRNFAVFQLLLSHGADASVAHKIDPGKTVTAVYECARQCNDSEAFASALIDAGVSPNQSPTLYETPVGCAIRNRCFELAGALIEQGSNLNLEYSAGLYVETEFQMTILGHVIEECSLGSIACLRFLFDTSLDQSLAFIVCRSLNLDALHILASIKLTKQDDRASRQILDLLLDHFEPDSSQLNMQTADTGMTALHFAAATANYPIIERLLAEGADPLLQNSEGFMPVDLARFWMQEFPNLYYLEDSLIPRKRMLKMARGKAERTLKILEDHSAQ